VQLALEIADALQEAHENGVIHCDLKPANIMLTKKGHAKVMDFGLAKMMARDSGTGWKEDSLATIVNFGTAVGTLSYMSPEQARCEEVDHRTDIFSLGAVIYEAITGQSAFSGESPAVVFEAILDRTPHLPSRLRPEVSSELDRIVNRCLEKDRELL
jgi:serine/threonine protein kinase